jgi:hypothetical protein
MRKARKLRDRLPCADGDVCGLYLPERPRGMWLRTYLQRLTAAWDASNAAAGLMM